MPPISRKSISRGSIAGFGLIEVLITLLILAIGLLGIAALQYRGLQYSHDAYLRSQVNVLAYAIIDKIRMGGGSANAKEYADAITDWQVPVQRPDCNLALGAEITGDAVVNNEVACWQQQVFDALPPGSTANITRSDEDNSVYTVTLTWWDRERIAREVAYSFIP